MFNIFTPTVTAFKICNLCFTTSMLANNIKYFFKKFLDNEIKNIYVKKTMFVNRSVE